MVRFDYAAGIVEQVIIPMTPLERRGLIEAPIVIRSYGGKSFAGHCAMLDKDSSHTHYLRAWRRTQAAGQGDGTHENGYLL